MFQGDDRNPKVHFKTSIEDKCKKKITVVAFKMSLKYKHI